MLFLQKSSEEEVTNYIKNNLAEHDTLSTDKFPEMFTKDVSIIFGNRPAITGLEANIINFNHMSPLLKSMSHKLLTIDILPAKNQVFVTLLIDYCVKNDPKEEVFPIPSCARWTFGEGEDSGKVKKLEAWTDPSAVFVRIGEVAALGGAK